MSARADLVTKVVELLQAAAPGVSVHRFAVRPIDKDHLPSIIPYVISVKPSPEAQTWGVRAYDLELRIESRTTGTPVDQVLDPLVSLVQKVMLREPFIGGLAFNVKEGETQYDAMERDRCYCAAATDFTVTFYEDPTGQGGEPFEPTPWSTLGSISVEETTP